MYLVAEAAVFLLPWQPPPGWVVQTVPLQRCCPQEGKVEVLLNGDGRENKT